MKLTRTSWMFLVAGVLIIAAVGLGMVRSQQADQQQQLEQQVSQARKTLESINNGNLAAQKDQLTAQIASYNSQLGPAKAKLSSSEDSISASNAVLKTAEDSGVDIISITSGGQSTETLANVGFSAIPLDIQLEGDLGTIRDFVAALGKTFPTGVVKSVQETSKGPNPIPSPADGSMPESSPPASQDVAPSPTPASAIPQPVSATLNLVIYNYGGN